MRNGKVALVTGSSTGIGAAVAKALARDGYDIALHYNRSPERAQEVQAEIEAMGVKTCLLHGDTSDAETPRWRSWTSMRATSSSKSNGLVR